MRVGSVGRSLKFTATAVVCLLIASAFSMLLLLIRTPSNNNYGTHLSYSGVPPPYYEVVATVTSMVDGDTTWVRIDDIVVELDPAGEVYEGNSESVRYGGGIDAPEWYMEGGSESTEFIESLIPVGTTVYLDLNDLSVGGQTGRPYRGTYERLIAVIYVELSGHWVNVNAELLRWGQEAYPDHNWLRYIYFPSEWNPYEWLEDDYPYVRSSIIPTSSVNGITPYWQTSVPFTVEATANPYAVNVALWYRHSSDDTSWGEWTSYDTDTSSPWEWSFNTPLGDGYYEFRSIAVDNEDNQESPPATADAECGVDTAAPVSSVDLISPSWQTSTLFTITATASDETSGVDDVLLYYRYSSDNSSWSDWMFYKTDTVAPWGWLITAPSGSGYYEFYSIAVDKATNAESAPAEADARCGVGDVVLGTPVKISPADGTHTNDNTPTFRWTCGADADSHRLLVDNDENFSSPEGNVLLGATDNIYTLSTPLADDNYSWKVVAINVAGESEFTVWTLLVDTVPPGIPAKSAPADGTSTTDSTPTFSWSTATDESSRIAVYELWVDNDPNFSSPEVLDNTPDNAATTYIPPALANDDYYWRVRAWDRAGNGSGFEAPWTLSIVAIVRGVEVTVLPNEKSGSPGEKVTLTVTVKNTGEVEDSYDLTASDDAGWVTTILDNPLTISAGENETTTITVTVPSDAIENESTVITVTATSRADPRVSDSATCTALAKEAAGFPMVPVSVSVVVIIVVIIAAVLVIKPF